MVVKLLLSHGAKCSKATFEGERCLYGALTDEIREMLIEAGQINRLIKTKFLSLIIKIIGSSILYVKVT